MKIYLLDTNTITAISEKNPAALQKVRDLEPEDEIVTCFIVIAEWEYGLLIANGRRRQQEIRVKGEPVLRRLSYVIESPPQINRAYAQISAELRKAGTMISLHDVWIAAAARTIGATVITHDKHFKHVQNLTVVDWTVPD